MARLSAESEKRRDAAVRIADAYRCLPGVVALFTWGSTATGGADSDSDVDFGVYARGEVPGEEARRRALASVADSPERATFGRFGRLEAVDRFSVSGVPVFVAWWDTDKELPFLRSRLDRLLDNLDDGLAENELGEIQRCLVLWDPEGIFDRLREEMAGYWRDAGTRLVSERLERARYEIENHIPRALAAQDAVWAEECRRSALNELVRIVFYLNGLFLRRLKGVGAEAADLANKPEGYVAKLNVIATSPVERALPYLAKLLQDVVRLSEAGRAPQNDEFTICSRASPSLSNSKGKFGDRGGS